MPEYSFRNADGETRLFVFSMRDVPSVGDSIDRDGTIWTRVFSDDTRVNGNLTRDKFPIRATSIPMRMEGFKHDKQGFTIVESRRQLATLERRGYRHSTE